MESLVEQARRLHEEMERLMQIMSTQLLNQPKGSKEIINMEHRMKQLSDRYMECAKQLKDLHEDSDGLLKKEVQELSGPNEFVEFYIRLRSIKDLYKRLPSGNDVAVPLSAQLASVAKIAEGDPEAVASAPDLADFTDEEGYGLALDLHAVYNEYYNLYYKLIQPKAASAAMAGRQRASDIDYLTYLKTFDHLYEIPKQKKMNSVYKAYLENLLNYLKGYLARVHPLVDWSEESDIVRKKLDLEWENGTFPGWPKEKEKPSVQIDLSAVHSWQELTVLGLDRLKQVLQAMSLKCGGTLEERAQRLFRTKGKQPEDYEQRDRAAGSKSSNAPTSASSGDETTPELSSSGNEQAERSKELAFLEAQIYHLVEALSEQRAASVENVERKQASTLEEREAGDLEGAAGAGEPEDEKEEDTDEVPYNPKDVPLGWDGKPIPYWLYKLHGLNLYFTCEICGNSTYRGPLAFQRHFTEWRHAHGMRCLGVPNTAHFHNITKIDEALALWEKLKVSKEQEQFKPSEEEEFEDSKGNILNKKTYEDLKRQGVL